jgi:hypothetical protein
MVHADVIPAGGMNVSDLDMPYFRAFFEKRYENHWIINRSLWNRR